MAEAPTMAPPQPPTDAGDGPTIRQRRSLPGGRAVVGAFLVVLAAVGTFGAYLQATAEPGTSYAVATGSFDIGEVLRSEDLTGPDARFTRVAVDLPSEQAGRVVRADALAGLAGQVVVAPIESGDLLQLSAVTPAEGVGSGAVLSMSLPADRALAGAVQRGERLDVIATFRGTVDGDETRVVARGVEVLAVGDAAEGLEGGRVLLTVRVPDLATAQQLQNAVDAAEVALVRGVGADVPDPEPDAAPAQDAPSQDAAEEAPDAGPSAQEQQAPDAQASAEDEEQPAQQPSDGEDG